MKIWFSEIIQSSLALISIIGVVVAVIQYNGNQKVTLQQNIFENYHKLIWKIAGNTEKTKENTEKSSNEYLITASAIYDLRRYPQYCMFSLKLLYEVQGQEQARWQHPFVQKTVSETIKHIEVFEECKDYSKPARPKTSDKSSG